MRVRITPKLKLMVPGGASVLTVADAFNLARDLVLHGSRKAVTDAIDEVSVGATEHAGITRCRDRIDRTEKTRAAR